MTYAQVGMPLDTQGLEMGQSSDEASIAPRNVSETDREGGCMKMRMDYVLETLARTPHRAHREEGQFGDDHCRKEVLVGQQLKQHALALGRSERG